MSPVQRRPSTGGKRKIKSAARHHRGELFATDSKLGANIERSLGMMGYSGLQVSP